MQKILYIGIIFLCFACSQKQVNNEIVTKKEDFFDFDKAKFKNAKNSLVVDFSPILLFGIAKRKNYAMPDWFLFNPLPDSQVISVRKKCLQIGALSTDLSYAFVANKFDILKKYILPIQKHSNNIGLGLLAVLPLKNESVPDSVHLWVLNQVAHLKLLAKEYEKPEISNWIQTGQFIEGLSIATYLASTKDSSDLFKAIEMHKPALSAFTANLEPDSIYNPIKTDLNELVPFLQLTQNINVYDSLNNEFNVVNSSISRAVIDFHKQLTNLREKYITR